MAGVGTRARRRALLTRATRRPATSDSCRARHPPESPSPGPSSSPSPIISSPTSASNAGVAVPLPDGWVVEAQDSESITLVSPSGTGSITIASGASSPTQNAQQNKARRRRVLQAAVPGHEKLHGQQDHDRLAQWGRRHLLGALFHAHERCAVGARRGAALRRRQPERDRLLRDVHAHGREQHARVHQRMCPDSQGHSMEVEVAR